MIESDFYSTIENSASAEFRDRGSKFVAYAYPVKNIDECKEKVKDLKKLHPKATHHCFAYRIGIGGTNFRASDDGEPSGTAGRPILGQIDSKGLVDIIIIVVRYFGGILLGTPGLINAYKTSASMVLQVTPIVRKPIEVLFSIQFDYTRLNEIMIINRQCNCRIIKQELQLFCNMTIAIPRARVAEFQRKLEDLQLGENYLEKIAEES